MLELSKSYLSVQYALRPAKQVERRMLLDALLLLSETGFSVRDYQYTGMGSIHFVDFAMFHKLLGIRSMLSVEASSGISNRVRFNAPYKNAVDLATDQEIGDVIPCLSTEKRHFLWLDYDSILSEYMLRDLALAATNLSPGSLLLITVDTEPPGLIDVDKKHTEEKHSASNTREYFERVAGDYVKPNDGDEDFEYDQLPGVNMRAIRGAIEKGLLGRSDAKFRLMFNFLYADGHRMLTLGGMIGGTKEFKRLRKSQLTNTPYYRYDFSMDPYLIRVPCVTRREQMYLDEHMPWQENWKPQDFELPEQDLEDYAKIYRFFPTYAELFL